MLVGRGLVPVSGKLFAKSGRPTDAAPKPQVYPIPQQKGTAMLKLAPVLALIGSPAFAQMQCGGYADAVAFLYERYGETLTVQGIDGAGNVIAMFANPDTGTWTAFIVYPDGTACMASSGADFEFHKPKPNA